MLITKGNSLNVINKNKEYFKTKHKKQASGSCFDCHGILKKQMQASVQTFSLSICDGVFLIALCLDGYK